LGAIPNYGGKTSEGTTASYHRWGMDKVPAPREIVDCLGEYVIGQVRERGMKAAPGPLIWLWLCWLCEGALQNSGAQGVAGIGR
jgi:hypothetical protein